jgi:ATP-dependent protease Clp ATPase subunit
MVKNNPKFAEASTFICRECIALCNAVIARKSNTEHLNYFKNGK